MSDYLDRRLAEFSLTDEEKEEVREYADSTGLETWAPEDESAFCCLVRGAKKSDAEDRVSMDRPLNYGFTESFGMLTVVPFVGLRSHGWEKRDEVWARYASGEMEWSALREEWGVLVKAANEESLSEYKTKAAELEDSETKLIRQSHVPTLSATVNELRFQLETSAQFLQGTGSGELLTGWLGAVETIVCRSSFDPFSENIDTSTVDTSGYGSYHVHTQLLRHALREGMPPAQALFKARELLRSAYERPDVIVKAQMGGLVWLVRFREPILTRAAKVRDELELNEMLLGCALMGAPPMSPQAIKALRKVQTERRGSKKLRKGRIPNEERERIWRRALEVLQEDERREEDEKRYEAKSGARWSDQLKQKLADEFGRSKTTVGTICDEGDRGDFD